MIYTIYIYLGERLSGCLSCHFIDIVISRNLEASNDLSLEITKLKLSWLNSLFFLYFIPLDPDPDLQSECGPRSTDPKECGSDLIRIHISEFMKYVSCISIKYFFLSAVKRAGIICCRWRFIRLRPCWLAHSSLKIILSKWIKL